MQNWTRERRQSFWIHLTFVLVPALSAVVAAFDLWATIFGSWLFSAPLVVAVEGVAGMGFYLKLRRIDSPFVTARHFIPVISISSLGYMLWWYLDSIGKPPSVAIGVTAFVVVLFGGLFVACIRKLEALVIDPLQAAEEKMEQDAEAVIAPLREHTVRAKKIRQMTEQVRELETPGFVMPPALALDDVRALLDEALPKLLPAPDDGRIARLLDRIEQNNKAQQALLEETGDLRERLAMASDLLEQVQADLKAERAVTGKLRAELETTRRQALDNTVPLTVKGPVTVDGPAIELVPMDGSANGSVNGHGGFTPRTEPTVVAPAHFDAQPTVAASVEDPPRTGVTVTTCEVCGLGSLDATEKGIAGRSKWKTAFNGRYACRTCREGYKA